jgi:hypothetical protein
LLITVLFSSFSITRNTRVFLKILSLHPPKQIKAAILKEMGRSRPYANSRPLVVEDVDLDPPGPEELLIKAKAIGLCHSDLIGDQRRSAKTDAVGSGPRSGWLTKPENSATFWREEF